MAHESLQLGIQLIGHIAFYSIFNFNIFSIKYFSLLAGADCVSTMACINLFFIKKIDLKYIHSSFVVCFFFFG